jgi:hypothetical protein
MRFPRVRAFCRSRVLLAAVATGLTVAAAGHAADGPRSWPGPPRTSPPQVAGTKTTPPPAWVETPQHSSWLSYSSYCWSQPAGTAACVDFLPPRSRTDLTVLSAPAGSQLRFHVRYAISKLSVSYLDEDPARLKRGKVEESEPAFTEFDRMDDVVSNAILKKGSQRNEISSAPDVSLVPCVRRPSPA